MKMIATICFCVLLSVALNFGFVPGAVAQDAAPAPVSPAAAPQPATQSSPNTLLDGTPVKTRISETISSADAKVGQEVPFEVLEDITVNGLTVIPKGASAIGTVTAAEPKRSMGRAGKLDISISYVRLRDQEKAALRAVKDVKGGGHVGAMTGAMVATSIVFFPAAPLFLFMHGKDITIPQGTEMTAFVQGDMRLDMSQFGGAAGLQAAAQGSPAASSAGPAPSSCSLVVQSTPPGADIEIDGAFVGNTPSTLTLAGGSHQVVVKKQGFADWSRNLNVTGGTINLNVEMNPAGN
jgi:hypothetical protein